MPHVELLPNSSSSAAPGWTYVVDTGYDPSKIAINPKNKKRAAAQPGGRRGESELSARQQTAIARRIVELQRDNDPKQSVPVPSHNSIPKTQNARRIIQYQRQIKHWLDDEEALLQQIITPRINPIGGRAIPQSLRRPTTNNSLPATPSEASPAPATLIAGGSAYNNDKPVEHDIYTPPMNSSISSVGPTELRALLSSPPLSYAASHAGPPPAHGPRQRHFCDNCGYWGSMRCLKCGTRVCGLECKDAHEATRCLKWA
ncbi:hypothetical protein BU24DRAFT_408416 [Aaosphaeria arxii CBS 175.79]|uniref:HIT-type domain-containing protein n=1 Tax=Aaosphaeria arxii CBS 175.79 TaxID=1450172 RepID=A0A6A5Y014_9PLEO|nr:uncharacterized protein BU24DRAFT_408416 [Aaosphaeria arxii CBS 175.79]KAF2018513.1 hypothetical protein BU24DRAFT_408416 [Aaosphaeria arxii CBS 175.79]